ncbi:Fic family protein [Mucilaginibacter arboris]|uniref:DUF4172 domain-containing protein n=1 Tax=Mucilaginibacter arboris TaxID=2682090 RepID=A0A7K1SWP3_9SPHI|nr:Fic family protein [Mucilaginibacter arboris]MVN21741.1 DUF4172 domain-containing protein [Mucilaginibacter arboris]
MLYNWQIQGWPNFTYNLKEIQHLVVRFAHETGEVNGIVQALPDNLQQETLLQLMLAEAVKTSEIEGEFVSREDVISSIRNNLGLNETLVPVKDLQAAGVAQLMVEVRKSFQEPLSTAMLKQWHKFLMTGSSHIKAGEWRKGTATMQVVSGAYSSETVHFEAPPSSKVPSQMEKFLTWFNLAASETEGDVAQALLKSAVAHLYFESIHPFKDGNGRIGRAIAEKALSQSLKRPVMLSLSKTIEKNKKAYYEELKKAQCTLEITDWIKYFATVTLEAQVDAKLMVQFSLKKARYFEQYKNQLNDRQLKAVNKMLDKGAEGFEGGMTAKKYMAITGASKATATRDLQYLYEIGALVVEGAGRSVRYGLGF